MNDRNTTTRLADGLRDDASWIALYKLATESPGANPSMALFNDVIDVLKKYPNDPHVVPLLSGVVDYVAQRGYVEPVEAAMDDVMFSAERNRDKALRVVKTVLKFAPPDNHQLQEAMCRKMQALGSHGEGQVRR